MARKKPSDSGPNTIEPKDREKIVNALNHAIAVFKRLLDKERSSSSDEELTTMLEEMEEAQKLFPEFCGVCKKAIDALQLENKNLKSGDAAVVLAGQNEKLIQMLRQAQDQIAALKEEVDKLSAPPCSYGIFSALNEDGTIVIYAGGRKMKVNLHPSIDRQKLRKGQEVILNDAFNVIAMANFEIQGEVVYLKELLDGDRAVVTMHAADEERVAILSDPLRFEKLRPGDNLLFDSRSGYLLEKLPKIEVHSLIMEEVPNVTYADIGGLKTQIEIIRDAIELPYLYADHFREHKLLPPKGVLLYGPPGCGKTLIAKAVANALAKKIEEITGVPTKSFFLSIKGPELLDKYVGETERKIREIFQRARDKASDGMPVVIFFDELDSLLRTRGSGISSDVESTIVPQFLAEIDGMEGLKNVIVIGASNRQDLIDSAVLRPGRFDVKIKIDRPDKEASKDIFCKYLTPDLPLLESEVDSHKGNKEDAVRAMIETTVDEMFSGSDEFKFLEITYQSSEKEVLYFKDFVSGALIQNVVTRAKKVAVKRYIATGEKGIKSADLLQAVRDEFKENEDLPNTTNPDDWARIASRKNDRIIHVRTIIDRSGKKIRKVETVQTGQYL